jgi:hypothetical protein
MALKKAAQTTNLERLRTDTANCELCPLFWLRPDGCAEPWWPVALVVIFIGSWD